jgi:hemerythrin-like domain-containing protein
MKPVGLLMMEHRLIERMLELIRREVENAESVQRVDVALLDTAVDFIRWYADRTHHAKEESILFRDLARKELSPADRSLLAELLEDHNFGRKTVGQLVEAKELYRQGANEALATILEKCRTLVTFYHEHIYKEDNLFFPASLNYLSEKEQEAMLDEFAESDRKMIHAKYGAVVEQYEKASE